VAALCRASLGSSIDGRGVSLFQHQRGAIRRDRASHLCRDRGFFSYGAGGQVEYFLNRQWSVHAITEYERITGSSANSPLVTVRGSPNQLTFGLGATYTFNMRPLW
jgi:opacity protein-like surface antigen